MIISVVVIGHVFNVRDIYCSFCDLDCIDIEFSSVDPKDLSLEEWLEDFRSFYSFIEENYPYIKLKERVHGYNWLDLKDQYEARIASATNNEAFLSILLDAVQALQNRHTLIINPKEIHDYHKSFSNTYPLCEIFCYEICRAANYWEEIYENSYNKKYCNRFETFIVYEKGFYIITEDIETCNTQIPKGSRVISVNNIPIDEAVEAAYEQDYLDWDFQRNKSHIWMISPRSFGENAKFSIQINGNIHNNLTFNCCIGDSTIPYPNSEQILNFNTWEEYNTAYMKVSSFDSQLYQYYKAIQNFYKQIETYENLILDIRGNEGGYYSYWIDFIVNPLIKEETTLEQYLAHLV
ncbi:MAG: S41 family peptidase [Candidatus Heimdallarchaeaceae archaeon]